jgi:phage tail protein X
MWDGIAYTQMGDTKYTDALISANIELCSTYIFPAGIELVIPDIVEESSSDLPPWRRVTQDE